MRTTTVKLAAGLALLLGGAVMADDPAKPADPNKPAGEKKPSQLEELIAQALRDNPDIRVAEAKTREAEAELSRVRLQVIQKVVAHQHTVETLEGAVTAAEANLTLAEANVRLAETEYQRMLNLKNAVTPADLDTARAKLDKSKADLSGARAALQAAKADLAKAQAELPYLLGKASKDDKQDDATKRALEWLKIHQIDDRSSTARGLYALEIARAEAAWNAADLPRGTVAEKLRKALDTPVSLKFGTGEVPLDDILAFLKQKAGTPIVTTLPRELMAKKFMVSLENVPLGATFQAVEDVAGVQFAVRDYGILVSDKLPSGVKRLHDFWKEPEKPAPTEGKK
jgi:hypothetical protein